MGFFAFLSRSDSPEGLGPGLPRVSRTSRFAFVGLVLAGAFAVATFGGCAAELENPERFGNGGSNTTGGNTDGGSSAPTCPDVPQVLKASCGSAGCHGGATPTSNLDLASPDVGNRLKTQKATTGDPLIDPANPENSVLYKKTLPKPPFGSSMPLNGTPFDDSMRACLATWIGGLK
ncbi:hypothetical protein AKJ09_02753 [Labilithrix luteola]|uniref:Uncharacterized protein n=1 Tax=Labilithrix luteola TaxID=1391654 RepID=A0A0K1PSI7_9BACT|nr:hypothetical protein [Labilithrix luteola]AKU96089.1 hypothetical protein AKJ09_02753 [Labilithrix luteola]